MEVKVFIGENPNVKKYVFTNPDSVYESVVYKYPTYEERTVICCSVQSGCPVGCVFCGTGKRFVRNLTKQEIIEQITQVFTREDIDTNNVNKLQIMFMSMGEPMLNWEQVKLAIKELNVMYPNAQLLLSTMGVKDYETFADIIITAKEIDKIGLQFSLHNSLDKERNELIPFKNKFTVREIRNVARMFREETNRRAYINYCVSKTNTTEEHINRMLDLFNPKDVCFTFSVICNKDQNGQDETDYTGLNKIQNAFLQEGYNVRVFDPAGKDDIGGGCGQLWYVQEWLKKHGIK